MVKKSRLKPLDQYTQAQRDQICAFSPATARGLMLIEKSNPQTSGEALRKTRLEHWCTAAFATYFETATTEQVCFEWSNNADQLLQSAFQECFGQDQKVALFALGKLGSQELNLSSDVDLLIVSEDEDPKNAASLRHFQSLLSQATDLGFVFRVDFDLRPGGRMGPLIPTVDQVMDYYGNYGETWERLALIRLRALSGNEQVIQKTEDFRRKFVFRKHLDFTLLNDLKALRKKIHSANYLRTTDFQIDLKLGIGGIRDTELFVHALQVLHGGRLPELHHRQTSKVLSVIQVQNLLPASEVDSLTKHYWKFRHWENLVQIENDQQTHLLLKDFRLSPPFQDLQKEMRQCDQIVSTLFGPLDIRKSDFPVELEAQKKWLEEKGYRPETVHELWPELISQSLFSRNKDRDEVYRAQFLHLFLKELESFPQTKDLALSYLKDFLHAVRAKSTFFALFLSQEQLVHQIAEIFAKSGYLAQMICQKPELIDSFIYRSQTEIHQFDQEHLLEALSEKKLLSELVAGTDFLLTIDLISLFQKTTETADDICLRLMSSFSEDENSWMDLVCLGKWGGKEMGLRSDLDFVFVTENDPSEQDMKKARRFLTRLTETHHRGGQIYDVDMRLKPSGKGGLIVTSKARLLHYLSSEAAPWERQAYLRARCLKDTHWNHSLHKAALSKKLDASDFTELERIRLGLLKNAQGEFDLKYSEGGLVDIEFTAQVLMLSQQVVTPVTETSAQLDLLAAELQNSQFIELKKRWLELRTYEQLHHVISRESGTNLRKDSATFLLIAQALKCSPSTFEDRLRSALDASVLILKSVDPRRASF